ncbi:glycoside hydrolase [Mycena leptocephala]|nr:glycoside hydrolase [Mycena leptocephala]
MISTSQNRATFIASVAKFLTQFGLDGIDIDFEYPAAIERNAPATDTPNLTSFFTELKAGLPSSALISIATPVGFWFLRGFQIDKIAPSVSYINMMSYDYHGQWDTNVTGQAPVTNPHTSILDMKDSVLLYIRAGIDMGKGKNIPSHSGLAEYARTYHLASATCKGYNCTMTGSGATGPCTDASGILAQFEVDRLISAGNKPILDQTTETYFFDTSSGDLVTFDQKDTLAQKSDFVAKTCLGGTFVWYVLRLSEGWWLTNLPQVP